MGDTGEDDTRNASTEQPGDDTRHPTQLELLTVVADKEARKLQARRAQNKSVWFGLGMFGMIGWSVAVPTLLGLALGIWLDQHWSVSFSWTLTLLFIGIALGCLNAWFWVTREREWIAARARPSAPLPETQVAATGEEQNDE